MDVALSILFWVQYAAPVAGLADLARSRRAAPRAARLGAVGLVALFAFQTHLLAVGYLWPDEVVSLGVWLRRAGVVGNFGPTDRAISQAVNLTAHLLLIAAVAADRRPARTGDEG